MSREFLSIIRADLKYVINGEFADELTITPIGGESVIVMGLHSLHSMALDNDGNPFVTNNAHINFIEKDLNDLGVVTRDALNRISVKDWIVEFSLANGNIQKFKLDEPMPDSDYGCVVVKLRKYA